MERDTAICRQHDGASGYDCYKPMLQVNDVVQAGSLPRWEAGLFGASLWPCLLSVRKTVHTMIQAYTKCFIRRLGDYDKPRTRKVQLTRIENDKLVGVVEGLVWRFKPREVFKEDGTRFSKRELKALLEGVG